MTGTSAKRDNKTGKTNEKLPDSSKKFVIADFVCPMHQQINFKPNYIFWMDTIQSRFSQMNKFFKKPKYFDLRIKEKIGKLIISIDADKLLTINGKIINLQLK